MSDDINDDGKKPEDDEDGLEFNIKGLTGLGEDDDAAADADETPDLQAGEETELPPQIQALIDAGAIPPEMADAIKSGEVEVQFMDGPEAGGLAEMFNQKVAGPMFVEMYHKHNPVDHETVLQQAIVVDLPRGVNPDEVKISVQPVPPNPFNPVGGNQIVVEASREPLEKPGLDYCPDVAGQTFADFEVALPSMTHPNPGSLSKADMVVEFDEAKGLVITVEATDESIQDQKDAIAKIRSMQSQMRSLPGNQF